MVGSILRLYLTVRFIVFFFFLEVDFSFPHSPDAKTSTLGQTQTDRDQQINAALECYGISGAFRSKPHIKKVGEVVMIRTLDAI